jgi:hypothetical protein
MKRISCLLRFFCLVVLTVLVGIQHASAQNWIQWRSQDGGNNHFYALTLSPTNWDSAQDMANSWDGHLTTITSAAQQSFINDTFLNGKYEHLPIWIGLARTTAKAAAPTRIRRALEDLGFLKATNSFPFVWVTGEKYSYSNWHPGQPDNFPPGESYVTINWHHSANRGNKGDWNDTPLNGTTGFGGGTDGPYFGLVERESDPYHPLRRMMIVSATCFGIVALLFVVIWFFRLRRRQSSNV